MPQRLERLLPIAFIVAAILVAWPLFAHPQEFADTYDWHYFQTWIEIARRTISWWHEVPLWNPWTCGGQVHLANPQAMVWSPSTLLFLAFGSALGTKLFLLLYIGLAFDGMYRLARSYALSIESALVASVVFGTNGWLALHMAIGHPNFAGAALFPYLVLFYRRSFVSMKYTACVGLFAAWIVGLGGTSTPAMAAVLLVTIAAFDAITQRTAKPFLILAASAGFSLLLGGARILPALEFALRHPRHTAEIDGIGVATLLADGFRWRGVGNVTGHRYGFHEYGWHVSFFILPLIAIALSVRRAWVFLVVALVGVSIAIGNAIPHGPWWLLRQLPVYRDLRVPSRYTILLVFAVSLMAAMGLHALLTRFFSTRTAARWAIAGVFIVATLWQGVRYNWFVYDGVFAHPYTLAAPGAPFYQEAGHWSKMMPLTFENHGVIKCDEEAPLQRAAALDVGDVPQIRLADANAGSVSNIKFSPNHLEADVTITAPTTVLFNQNWNEHWKANVGRVVKFGAKWPADTDGGRLAVGDLPLGTTHVAVYYHPTSFLIGLAFTGAGLALLLLLMLRRKRPIFSAERPQR